GSSNTKLATLPFSRDRKSMSVLARHTATQRNRLFVKGGADVLLNRCTSVQFRDGTIVPLTPELRAQLKAQLQEMAERPLRCLAFAVSTTTHCLHLVHVKLCIWAHQTNCGDENLRTVVGTGRAQGYSDSGISITEFAVDRPRWVCRC